jgi:hypothetical protein
MSRLERLPTHGMPNERQCRRLTVCPMSQFNCVGAIGVGDQATFPLVNASLDESGILRTAPDIECPIPAAARQTVCLKEATNFSLSA